MRSIYIYQISKEQATKSVLVYSLKKSNGSFLTEFLLLYWALAEYLYVDRYWLHIMEMRGSIAKIVIDSIYPTKKFTAMIMF